MDVPASTVEGLATHPSGVATVLSRRGLLALLAVVVACGGVGLLGLHTSEVTGSAHGYHLTLRYPAVARAGLDTTWQVRVTHPGGFGDDVELAVTGDYFDIFETQGFHPDASKSTRDGSTLYLTFDPPPGDTFVLDFDAYVQPSSQRGRRARVALLDAGADVVHVDYRTRLLP